MRGRKHASIEVDENWGHRGQCGGRRKMRHETFRRLEVAAATRVCARCRVEPRLVELDDDAELLGHLVEQPARDHEHVVCIALGRGGDRVSGGAGAEVVAASKGQG